MNRETLVFVESNTSGTGRLFARAAADLGFRPVLLAESPERYPWAQEDDVTTLVTSTSSESEVLAACATVAREGRLVGVTTSSDYFVAMAARVATRLALPGPGPVALSNARDKGMQRRILVEAGVACPSFTILESSQSAADAASALGFPVVVKPVDGSGSLGVALCATGAEVTAHVTALLARTHNERGIPLARRVVMESFIQGPEFSVETFAGRAIGVTRKHVAALPSFVERGHDFPAPLEDDERTALVDTAEAALAALELDFGPAHVELKRSPSGPVIVEVNPRLAGGFIPELVRHATGIDLVRETVRAASGGVPLLEPRHADHASIRFLFPPRDGTLERVDGLAQTGDVVDARVYRSPGAPVALRGDFRDRIGHVLAVAADGETARRAAERGHAAVRVSVRGPGAAASPSRGDALENTGRITRGIGRTARRILFGDTIDHALDTQLEFTTRVDRAHVVMLVEQGLMDRARASRLLAAIDELRASHFAPLRGKVAPRGLYLVYENYLIETTGMETGGVLQLGRSRNDLNATTFRLRLRAPSAALVRECLRLSAVLVRRARRYARVTMPAYTHWQAAIPITYGHYLAAIATAIDRDLAGLLEATRSLDDSPLGSGAVAGTSLPINPERTAALLGFSGVTYNSIDAVASRDVVPRVLSAAALLGGTLSRVATDLLLWTTTEFGFLALPDHVVGSSSMMPQKRNAYFLEHVQGRAASAAGAFVTAVTAAHAKPFTNSIAVGTESVRPLWDALRHVTEAVILCRLILAEATPNPAAMLSSAEAGFTTATELANRLVVDGAMPFRAAHHAVGALVRECSARGEPLARAASDDSDGALAALAALDWSTLDAASVAHATAYGGGPGGESIALSLSRLEARWKQHAAIARGRRQRWTAAEVALDRAARQIGSHS